MKIKLFMGLAILSIMLLSGFVAAGEFEDLGIPVKTASLFGYSRCIKGGMVGPDENGMNHMLYFSFRQDAAPMFMIQVDVRTGKVKRFNAPQGNRGGWGFYVGKDKKIYIGTYSARKANILCFDPKHPERQIQQVATPSETETYIWRFTTGKDGKLYMGTWPQAKLLSYNPTTGESEDLGRMDQNEAYSYHVGAGKNGWIYVGTGVTRPQIYAYNPKTKEKLPILPEAELPNHNNFGDGSGGMVFEAEGHAYGLIGNRAFLLLDGKGVEMNFDEVIKKTGKKYWYAQNNFDHPLADGRILLSADLRGNYSLFDPKTKDTISYQYEYEGAGTNIFSIAVGPQGVIYGGSILPMDMFSYHPETKELRNLGNLPVGELYSLMKWHDDLYVCDYPAGAVWCYTPGTPWNPGSQSGNNPQNFGPLGDGHQRPRIMIKGPNDTFYIGSLPKYGVLGGAMAVFDPKTNQVVENYRNIVQDQSIISLTYHQKSGLIFGGSVIAGGGGAKPKAKEAHFFSWDLVKKKKVLEIVPVAETRAIISMCTANDQVFFINTFEHSDLPGKNGLWNEEPSPNRWLSVFDIHKMEIVHQVELPFCGKYRPPDVSLGVYTDGFIYGLTDTSIIRINPENYSIEEVAKSPVKISKGWALADTGIYFGSGVNLWRYHW